MSKIDELRSLVEEVRSIVRADSVAEDAEAREAVYQEAADEIVGEIFEAPDSHGYDDDAYEPSEKHHGKRIAHNRKAKHLGKQKLKGADGKAHKAGHHHKADHGGGMGGDHPHLDGAGNASMKGKFKKRTGHSPYKRSRKIGAARTGVAAPTVRTWRGYWKCRSQGAYKQLCIGSKGERKKVRIKRGYKKKYNAAYRKWRANASKFKKGVWTKSFDKG